MSEGSETRELKKPKQPLPVGVFALFTPDEAMEKDRPLRAKRRLGTMLGSGILLGIVWGLAQSPEFVENVYARGFGQSLSRGLATVTGLLPNSLAEVCHALFAAAVLVPAGLAAWEVFRRRRRLLNALACGGLRFGAAASVLVVLFYVVWGLNYARADLFTRNDWSSPSAPMREGETETEELVRLCGELVVAANLSYERANGSRDLGHPSMSLLAVPVMDEAIDEGYERMAEPMGFEEGFGASRGLAKPVAASELMSYLSIGGFYFPWTGEANYNRLQPACQLPLTIAHEKAHQRGVASEDEANFVGFLACLHTDDPYIRYSAYLFAQRQLLNELARIDLPRAKELVARRHPGVQRDVDDLKAYWIGYQQAAGGAVVEAERRINDAYLKTNGVDGGVKSYRLSSRLLVRFARRNDGTCLLPYPGMADG